MTGEPRRYRSKWDTKEGPPDIVEISEDESPQNKDVHRKGSDLLPKPDASMHRGNGGHEQEHHDGVNKDMKDIQASSERSQPSKFVGDKGWGKFDMEKPHGNHGTNRYADDRRRGDGWGAALDRGYSSRMHSDSDPWKQRSRSPSPRGAWNRSHRNRSRSRSRSRNRSRSRSRSRSRGRGRGRSRSPYFVDRGPDWRVERGRTSGGPLLCRDFVAGTCRRGLNCRFPHEDGRHRPFEEHYPAGPRERYGYQGKEFMDSREQSDFLPSRQSRGRYDDETWERSEPRRDYRSSEQCYNFAKGRCIRGASCRFAHDDSAPRGGWRDEARQNSYDRVGPDSSYGNRIEHRRVNKTPCKFFASGQCRRGANCPYLHEEAPQSQMGLSAPDEPSSYNNGPTGRGNFSSWGEQNNVTHATSQSASRDDRENQPSSYNDGPTGRGNFSSWGEQNNVTHATSQGASRDDRENQPSSYNDGPTGRGNFSNWGEQNNVTHATSQNASRDDRENHPSSYNNGPTGRGNFSSWGDEQNNVTHAASQSASRDDRENPVSQSIGINGSRYEYENRHPKDAGKSQYQIVPQEGFDSQVHKNEVAATSQQPQLLTPVQTSADSMNNDKVSGSAPGTAAGNLSMHTGMHAGTVAENLGHILQSQDAVSQIHVPPTLPVTTHLQNNTSSLPSNSHMQQSNFPVHPQEQFLATQAAASSNSARNVRDQPATTHMGVGHTTQLGYGLEAQALPNLSAAHSGHNNFSVSGQVPQDLSTSVHAGQQQGQQAAIELHRLGQDSGAQAQSIQNMQNFQPVAPNVGIQNQSFQGPSLVPASSSADMVGAAPVSHAAAAKSEDIQRVTASLAQFFGNAGLSAGAVGLQPSEPNMSSGLMAASSAAAPSAVQPNHPWPWAAQQHGMVQPALPVLSEQHQQAPQTFQMPMVVVGSGTNNNGNSMPLPPHSGAPARPAAAAAASAVNETVTSVVVSKKGETKDAADAEANNEDGENNNKKSSKDSKALKMFKIALADFVKEALKPTWKEGQLTREVHKTIVKKVVDKVTSTVENTPPTKEKIDIYMSFSKEKLNKLVQAYVGKYVNANA